MYPFEIISEKVWMPTGNFIVFAIFCLFFYKVNEKNRNNVSKVRIFYSWSSELVFQA